MNYFEISKDNMVNGDGIRVVLWVAGCEHHCKNCHNQFTWNKEKGFKFDDIAKEELFKELSKDYVDGITFSGGDPLAPYNINEITELAKEIKEKFPKKNIWCYTGYTWEELYTILNGFRSLKRKDNTILDYIDVLCEGKFEENKKDPNLLWVGSSNQRIIDIKKTLEKLNEGYSETNSVVLYITK